MTKALYAEDDGYVRKFHKRVPIPGDLMADRSESGEEKGKIRADVDQTEQEPSKGKLNCWSNLLKGQKTIQKIVV